MNDLNGSLHQFDPQRKDENARNLAPFLGQEPGFDSDRPVAPKLPGCGLSAADYAGLEARWIDRSLADRAQLRRVDSLTGGEVIGRNRGNYAGILIPYRGIDRMVNNCDP